MQPGDWIAIAGVISTSLFSCLIWKAAQSSAKMAEATYQLSESIERNRNEIKETLKDEYVQKVFNKAMRCVNNLFDVLEDNYCSRQFRGFQGLGLTDLELVKYFDAGERQKIKMAFSEYSKLAKMLDGKQEDVWDLDYVRYCKDEMWEVIELFEGRISYTL